MTWHPRERYGRREFIGRTALGALALSSAGTLLSACGGDGDGGSDAAAALKLARPDRPVTLPLYDDNPAIASGLAPEQRPLRIYNWADYIDKATLKQFSKEHGVEVEVTTFSTMDEATAKIATGAVSFDLFFPTNDRLERMALAKHLQPLNLDYLPNLANVWPALQNPFYDQGSRYTVPYTTYTTGIGYRTDKLAKAPGDYANPYETYFDTAYKGKTWLLDDGREAPAAMLLKNGLTDLNTERPEDLELAKRELLALVDAVNVKVSTEDYTKLPEGAAWVHQAWSGSMVAAPYYLPKSVPPEVIGYWFPADGAGPIGNDMMAVLRGAKSPVLAHLLIDFLLSEAGALSNFAFVGYQPPLTALGADRLVSEGLIPETLTSAIVRESDFEKGLMELELSPAGQTLWQNTWAEFKAGV